MNIKHLWITKRDIYFEGFALVHFFEVLLLIFFKVFLCCLKYLLMIFMIWTDIFKILKQYLSLVKFINSKNFVLEMDKSGGTFLFCFICCWFILLNKILVSKEAWPYDCWQDGKYNDLQLSFMICSPQVSVHCSTWPVRRELLLETRCLLTMVSVGRNLVFIVSDLASGSWSTF